MCRNGIIGGFIYVTPERLIYQTGKISISKALQNIEMPFSDVISTERGKFLFLPTVSFKMKDGGEFKYIIYSVKRFFGTMKELGCDI